MDEVFQLILTLWRNVFGLMSNVEFSYNGFTVSFLSFCIGLIIIRLFLRSLLILPEPGSNSSNCPSSVSERNDNYPDKIYVNSYESYSVEPRGPYNIR